MSPSLSSSLLVPASPRVWSEVRVDPRTGVRARDSNWLEQARRSQIVVMNRGSVPAPAATYNISDVPDALERWEVPWRDVLEQIGSNDYVGSGERQSRFNRLVNAALDVTLRSMLPEVIGTLARMREDDIISKNTLIWHGAWYKQPQCASGKPSSPNILSEVLDPSLDPWTLYHNLQGMLLVPLLIRDTDPTKSTCKTESCPSSCLPSVLLSCRLSYRRSRATSRTQLPRAGV